MIKIGTATFPYNVFCAVGARGFLGEGYLHDRFFRHIPGCTWEETNSAFKTVTLEKREGNMPLCNDGIHPRETFSRSIVVEPFSGHVLNAVSWSNFGLEFYAKQGIWQEMCKKESIVISIGTESTEMDGRLREIEGMRKILIRWFKIDQRRNVVLHLNFGCPNVQRFSYSSEIYTEIRESLTRLQEIGLPIVVAFNPITPAEIIAKVTDHRACSGLWLSNTVPWGYPLGEGKEWKDIFGSHTSPFQKRGFNQSGGLSGPYCLPLVIRQVAAVRKECLGIPIIAGNGIQCAEDGIRVIDAGANAIAIGIVKIVRPWRMRSIITGVNQYCYQRERLLGWD